MKIKAYAVVTDDGFIPDFSNGIMKDVYQIHSTKKSADNFCKEVGKGWKVVSVLITKEVLPN